MSGARERIRRVTGSLYWRQFMLTAGMVLLTLALLGVSFYALSYNYTLSEKRQEMRDRAVLVAQETIERQKRQLDEMKPKAVFADAVATSKTSILIGDLAKILKQNGVDMGQRRLFEWMRQRGYLMRANGSSHNMPTQRSMERGWFEIKETSITHSDGHITVQRTPKVTGKGQQYFINLFLNGAA